jgi:hypothetical protein
MALEKIEQHVELGLLKLAPAYFGKPRIGAGLASLLREIQTLEDAIWQQFELQHIETADRPRLVVMGKLIGQTPQGFSLEQFRTVIRARALANRSRGRGPDIAKVLVALLGAGNFAFLFAAPGIIYVAALDPLTDDDAAMARAVLPYSSAAGVQIQFFWADAADYFMWGGDWGETWPTVEAM